MSPARSTKNEIRVRLWWGSRGPVGGLYFSMGLLMQGLLQIEGQKGVSMQITTGGLRMQD